MKKTTLLISIILMMVSQIIFAQSENCYNAIDDDGDGQIDLNDSDCVCDEISGTPSSLIPNPSFEELDCCPSTHSLMSCAVSWEQASAATSDLFNECGFFNFSDFPTIPMPLPDGSGFVGFVNGINGNSNYKEYIGSSLNATMLSGIEYTLQFDLGFGLGSPSAPAPNMNITMFGSSSSNGLPFSGACPQAPDWIELFTINIAGENEWVTTTITFTPQIDIGTIIIGPNCTPNIGQNYYYLDNLVLAESTAFTGGAGLISGHPCSDNQPLVLEAPSGNDFDYQWYEDGIAIIGETDSIFQIASGVVEGHTYQVLLDDGNNCLTTAALEFIQDQIDITFETTNIICYAGNDGSIILENTGGTAPYQYNWSNGAIDTIGIHDLEAGIYDVTVTDANGCQGIASIELFQPTEETTTVEIESIHLCFGESTNVSINPTYGEAPYSYVWSSGQNTSELTDLSTGTYMVTVTDINGCTLSRGYLIEQADEIVLDVIMKDVSCYGYGDGSIHILASDDDIDPLIGYSINTVDFQISNIFPYLDGGIYNITFFDMMGCRYEQEVVILEPDAIEIFPIPDTTILFGESIGTNININTADPLEILVSPDLFLDCSNCEEFTISPTDHATYIVTATNEDGCFDIDTFNVFIEKPRNIYFPNAFTPNEDNINDQYFVYGGNDVIIINSLRIFNRWGELVFEKKEFLPEDLNSAWDGNFKGKKLQTAVYVYVAEIVFNDGDILQFTGDINLIR